jgi:plasmid maintenance system antidote protein VapI
MLIENISVISMTISEVLIKTIEASKESKYAIAVGAGIDHASLRRFLKGERSITVKTADKLAAYFGLTLTKKGSK